MLWFVASTIFPILPIVSPGVWRASVLFIAVSSLFQLSLSEFEVPSAVILAIIIQTFLVRQQFVEEILRPLGVLSITSLFCATRDTSLEPRLTLLITHSFVLLLVHENNFDGSTPGTTDRRAVLVDSDIADIAEPDAEISDEDNAADNSEERVMAASISLSDLGIRLTKQRAAEKLLSLQPYFGDNELAKEELRAVVEMITNQKLDKVEFGSLTCLETGEEDPFLRSYLEAQLTDHHVGMNYTSNCSSSPILPYHSVTDETSSNRELSEHLQGIERWDFDVFQLKQLSRSPLTVLFCYICFNKFKFQDSFSLKSDLLREWCLRIESSYHANPYHNAVHAADVLQGCYWFALALLRKYPHFPKFDVFCLMVAAVIHDTDHPGVNSAFLSNTLSSIALLYNDRSILENHHVSEAFRLAVEMDVFGKLPAEQFIHLRKTVVETVLATDMSRHVSIVAQLESLFQKEDADCRLFDTSPEAAANLQLLLTAIIKAADISNPARPVHISKLWSARITAEFFAQGDRERERGIPVSQFMDRSATSIRATQLGFIHFVVAPLFSLIARFLPGAEECLKHMEQVRAYWTSCSETATFREIFDTDETAFGSRASSGRGSPQLFLPLERRRRSQSWHPQWQSASPVCPARRTNSSSPKDILLCTTPPSSPRTRSVEPTPTSSSPLHLRLGRSFRIAQTTRAPPNSPAVDRPPPRLEMALNPSSTAASMRHTPLFDFDAAELACGSSTRPRAKSASVIDTPAEDRRRINLLHQSSLAHLLRADSVSKETTDA
eukprot:gnl/Spiro4/6612_TR3411_c0_g1_i1.p1 gnl/Spiro4/6612_TR3411_c0_g1~~gnl/Spiro4/6612_TR3411_c0_g1_i1.p1  ORF type:complete len:789 (-),score=101.72 gnl/Spiro4/6612_TR3411_c0_g1_i1:65-2404(-)